MKNNSKLAKITKGIFVTAFLAASLVACGKKADNTQPINAFTQNCAGANCQSISGFPFFSAQTQAYLMSGFGYNNALSLNWSFSGQNTAGAQQQQGYNQYTSPAMNYVGLVSATGQVNVSTPLSLGFCPQIPSGQYSLNTQTIGQWANGAISGLRFVISGPVSIIATLNQAQAYEYGFSAYSTSSKVSGTLVIEQVNGYFCQGANFQLW